MFWNCVFIQEAFLPTMPDDNTIKVMQWLKEKKLKQYCKCLMEQRHIGLNLFQSEFDTADPTHTRGKFGHPFGQYHKRFKSHFLLFWSNNEGIHSIKCYMWNLPRKMLHVSRLVVSVEPVLYVILILYSGKYP